MERNCVLLHIQGRGSSRVVLLDIVGIPYLCVDDRGQRHGFNLGIYTSSTGL